MPGFSWTELYTMPVSLRKFYYDCVVNKIKRHNEAIEAQTEQIKAQSSKLRKS